MTSVRVSTEDGKILLIIESSSEARTLIAELDPAAAVRLGRSLARAAWRVSGAIRKKARDALGEDD